MRIVAWNCGNGISNPKQIDYLKSLHPDIAILPEMKEKNVDGLRPDSFVWVTMPA